MANKPLLSDPVGSFDFAEPLRTALSKCESNFAELYAAGGGTPGGSNHQVQINASGTFGGIATGTANQFLLSGGAAADPLFANFPAITTPASFQSQVTFSGPISKAGVLTPGQLAASVNNYDFGIGGVSKFAYRLVPAVGGSTITGISPGSTDNYDILLINTDTTDSITLAHNSASSSNGNKILCPNGVNVVIRPTGAVRLWYDVAGLGIWRVVLP